MKPSEISKFIENYYYSASIIVCFMGHTVQAIKGVIKAIKRSQVDLHTTTIIFTVAAATDRQRHEDQVSSSPCAYCKCNGQGICVFLYLIVYLGLCSFFQWSRTRPWWHLSISWWRRKTKLRLGTTALVVASTTISMRTTPMPNSRIKLMGMTIRVVAHNVSGTPSVGPYGGDMVEVHWWITLWIMIHHPLFNQFQAWEW